MKNLILLTSLALVTAGCCSVTGSRTLPDGSQLAISSHRFFWASEGIKATTEDLNGFKFGLEVQKSNTDAQALAAVAEGVAKGLAAGATKP